MAKGSISKEEVFNKLLEVFPNSFMYNEGKECRINMVEDGELVQIKVTLTAAKTPVSNGEDCVLPGAEVADNSFPEPVNSTSSVEISEEEKQTVQDLMTKLGL